ncbi:MAG: hypothetical protein Q8K36_02900, partial [Alphaproteobacteria bacterium]|nr:hypothetical protein [Alphaproteobacteria bacterium]
KQNASPLLPAILSTFITLLGVVAYSFQEMLQEVLYFCWKIKNKNIELVDDEIVHIVCRKINSLDEDKRMPTLQAIKTFLPGLLQKRTWGFAQQLKAAIEAIKIR